MVMPIIFVFLFSAFSRNCLLQPTSLWLLISPLPDGRVRENILKRLQCLKPVSSNGWTSLGIIFIIVFLHKIDCSVSANVGAGLVISDFKNENVLRLRKKVVFFSMLCVLYYISYTHNKNNFVNLNRVYTIM